MVEADLFEERGGVVHEGVEAAELLEGLHAAGDDDGAAVDGVGEHGAAALEEGGVV